MSLAWESPRNKEIATPVCALVRNDSILGGRRISRPFVKECFYGWKI